MFNSSLFCFSLNLKCKLLKYTVFCLAMLFSKLLLKMSLNFPKSSQVKQSLELKIFCAF